MLNGNSSSHMICMSMSQWTCFEFGGKIGASSLHPEALTASIGNTANPC